MPEVINVKSRQMTTVIPQQRRSLVITARKSRFTASGQSPLCYLVRNRLETCWRPAR